MSGLASERGPGSYSTAELMAVVMARELRPQEVAIMGAVSLIPQAACRLAQLTSAPGLWYVAGGSGAVNPRQSPLVESSCSEHLLNADLVLPLPEVVMMEGRGDIFDVFFAGGLQIDARGNCNLGPVGPWDRPTLRGPGGVGLPFIAWAGRVVIYTSSHDRRTFVERVDFISGPGFPESPSPLPGGGPSLVVTPLCVMDFDPVSRRARLMSVHPGVNAGDVIEATGFDLNPPDLIAVTPVPTQEELSVLRTIDSTGLLRNGRA